ncbi:MAG TPA: SRPBCC family protein [Burkholderiaceae bacterium]|nr:SRPBCC family protein [Burkholderiaceae bacterium]
MRSIEVQPTGEGYVIDLVMWTPVARELAFEVLIDFEHVASWTPNVRESRVLKRAADRVTVEYKGSVRLGAVTVPFTTVREVEFTAPALIESIQIKGTMKRHTSRISFAAEDAGTRVDYHLEMVPSAVAAGLLSKVRLEQEFRETFDAAASEMLRRKSAATLTQR